MKKSEIIYKQVGETPLEALERFRAGQIAVGNAEFAQVPMTYAGRLDPMAEGVLLILIGDECKNKERWLGLDKEYEVEIVFGIETDTYDALGLASRSDMPPEALSILGQNLSQNINNETKFVSKPLVLAKYTGRFSQEYPPYSSRTVNGTPLHELARAGELPEEMPTKEVEVKGIELLEQASISAHELKLRIFSMVDKVKGDFRQIEIKKRWDEVLDVDPAAQQSFPTIKIRVQCSSGTYMRSLAHRMGGFAIMIRRVKIFIK